MNFASPLYHFNIPFLTQKILRLKKQPQKVHKNKKNRLKQAVFMVAEEGFEPTTFGL